MDNYQIKKGRPHPLGAHPDAEGVNFAVFSQHATAIELLLFNRHDDIQPMQIIQLDPLLHKTFHFWHCYIPGLKAGYYYAYRVDGPRDNGHRFNRNKVLIDPYSYGNTHHLWNRLEACEPNDNLKTSMRSVIIDIKDYDWEGDTPLNLPLNESIIYELHIRSFTAHPSADVKYPGTFHAVIEKIPHLKALGITTVEFMPVMDFDLDGHDYWGYAPISFFAPQSWYCFLPEAGNHLNEFRDMVKALHKAGIEIILDVVFNHTSEGNHQGPMINFKGFDNSIYYLLNPKDKQYYLDYSGCGNTVSCNHPIVEKMIFECLSFWVTEMHVDGFRFDEASILSRDQKGNPMDYPPLLWNIELSESLADTKIIAECWDAAGLYQVGYFPGYRWAEWNGRFEEDIRHFVRGDPGMLKTVANRIGGSADIFKPAGQLPINSINFVTCHDGFTLYDLVSYNKKYNWDNGEENKDGVEDNISWNCGHEGETEDESIQTLRKKQIKNFMTILMFSQGVPMLAMGDEACRTKKGNNNTWCQDNEVSWFDWNLIKKNSDIFRFFKIIIAVRKSLPMFKQNYFFTDEINQLGLQDISWHGPKLHCPEWNNPEAKRLAFTLRRLDIDSDVHVMMNMDEKEIEFEVPAIKERSWYRLIDTALPSPDDICEKENKIITGNYLVSGRSIVVLLSKDNL